MYKRVLTVLAVFGQLLAVYPFAVLAEGVGFGSYTWWHYFLMYGGIGVFYGCGRLLGCWVGSGSFSRRVKPFVTFLARIGVIAPTVLFCVVCALMNAHSGLYIYLLPGCIASYYAGYLSFGKDYSDIFTRGWFAVFFVASVLAAILIGFTHDDALVSDGTTQLCVSFGVMMITAAILTNQTNIDVQTRQRAGGRAVLPRGVRSYNSLLIAGAGAVILFLCLFAKPAAEGITSLLKLFIARILSLLRDRGDTDYMQGDMENNSSDTIDYFQNSNEFAQLMIYLLIAVMVLLAVKFRRQLWRFIKDIFAPLFRVNIEEQPSPFVDEVSASSDVRLHSRENLRTEREILRKYRREADPVLKYRLGYELFLMRLGRSAFPQLPTDTTTIHRSKGGMAFGGRTDESGLEEMVRQYNRVRYGGEIPGSAALEQLDRVLEEIR